MNKNDSKKNIVISILLIAFSAVFYGTEQGFNTITVNLSLQGHGTGFIFGNHHLTLCFFLGCIIGIILLAFLSYFIGRKKTYIFTIILIILSLAVSHCLTELDFFWFRKMLLGITTGGISFIAPLYIAELSPVKKRGCYIALFELMITIGILLVLVLRYFDKLYIFSDIRFIFLPAIIVFILCMFYLKKSFKWSSYRNDIKSYKKNTGNTSSNLSHKIDINIILKVLLLGIAIQALQQLSGINAMIYYSARIFRIVGFTSPIFDTASVVAVKTIATLLVINLIDTIGRRHLLYFGLTMMGISLIFFSFLFLSYSMGGHFYFGRKLALLFCSLIYISAYAMSIGPIAWLLCIEIFPIRYRTLGVAVTTSTNWIFNSIVVFFSLSIIKNLNIAYLFLFFGICCIMGLFLVRFFIPETRNIEFEEIEVNLKNNVKLKDIGEPEVAPYEFIEFD